METLFSYEQIKKIQLDNFNTSLDFCKRRSPYYKDHLHGVALLNDLDESRSLPFTEKDTFSQNQDAFLCVPEEKVVDISTTSGSTGVPLIVKLTQHDLERLAYNEFLSFTNAGLTSQDRVLLAVTLDKCFVAGLAYFSGLQRIGAAVVRVGPTSPEMLLSMARKVNATAIVGVPSYLLRVSDYAKAIHVPLKNLGIGKLVLIGEPIRNQNFALNPLGTRLKETWGCSLSSTYGLTEIQTSFCECNEGQGGHLHSDLVHVEIIDDNGLPVGPGEIGEVVVTTFGIEGMPLIRYKTGDVSFLETKACGCGLKTPRLGPILGRKKQKLKIKGTTLYLQAILNVMDEMAEVEDYVVIITSVYDMSDHIEILLCFRSSHDLTTMVKERLKGQLKISPELTLSNPTEILKIKSSASERKKTKIIDRRETWI
jgi:phenylacetate-CoA ligase